VVTANNWREYVTGAVVVDESTNAAVANFTITLPAGCTIPLSVVSYRIRTCGTKFPQQFIDGSDSNGKSYGAGTYVNQMRVHKTTAEYQVDLRFEGFTWGHELTREVEDAHYSVRTIAWLVDRVCLPVL
jgi:hypothetical protein